MRIALVGGTHGNEPIGYEVMQHFRSHKVASRQNSYDCFWANPKAYERKSRYVDSDLNRAFGKNASPQGHEKLRAQEIEKEISGHYDFSIDLHTTTSNMGLTAIMNNTHPDTRKAALYLTQKIPQIKIIEEDVLDENSTHLNRLCPAGLTIEVGPVANNVLKAELIFATAEIVRHLLEFDFSTDVSGQRLPIYKMVGKEKIPQGFYIHPKLDGQDFRLLKKGQPTFINFSGEVLGWDQSDVFPFFINEAAYQEHDLAFLTSIKEELTL